MKIDHKYQPALHVLENRMMFDGALVDAAAADIRGDTKPAATSSPKDKGSEKDTSNKGPTTQDPVVEPPAEDPNLEDLVTEEDEQQLLEELANQNNQPEPEPEPTAETTDTTRNNGNGGSGGNSNDGNNSTTPTDQAGGAGKSDEEKNDRNVSGQLGDQGNNETKNDIKGNAGGENDNGAPTEVSRETETETVTTTEVSEPVVTTTSTDSTFCRADTENNQEIETTVRTYTDTSTVTTTVTTTTTPITTITYSNGRRETVTGEPTVTTTTTQSVTTATRQETISTDRENPDVETEWVEDVTETTSEPVTTTEFVGETVTRVLDESGLRWIITTVRTYRDTTVTDTTTTTTRTPLYTISYCDGTVENETGDSTVTTATTRNTVQVLRDDTVVTFEDIPQPEPEPEPEPEPQTVVTAQPAPEPTVIQTTVFNPVTQTSEPITFTLAFTYPNTFDTGVAQIVAINFTPITEGSGELFVMKSLESVTVEDRTVDYTIPTDTFGHTNPDAKVDVRAFISNGSDLPPTLFWDAQTGRLTGTLPEGVNEVEIVIEATDADGRKAEVRFTIRAGEVRDQVSLRGKPGLTEQIAAAIARMKAELMA